MAERVVRFRPRPTMGGDGDGERQDDERKVELDPDLKKMLEDFIGAPIDDKTHPFWNPPPLTEEQEAMFEDVKRRAKECVGLDGFTEDLLLKDMHVQYMHRLRGSWSIHRRQKEQTIAGSPRLWFHLYLLYITTVV